MKDKNENKMQLTKEKRIFITKSYYEMKLHSNSNLVQNFVSRTFTTKTTSQKIVKKYERDGTSLNMNKGRSERRVTTRTKENTETVQKALEQNQERISARRNGLQILPSSFCRTIKKVLRWYPYKMIRRHNLKDGDYEGHTHFCQ